MILKICDVDQELERCHLCDGIVARGDAVRESPGIDDEGVRYVALEHAQCVAEDERMGVTGNLDAEERGACMADLPTLEDCVGEPVSPEYRAFRADVDARVPALTVDVRRLALATRDLATTVARAQAAEAKVKALESRWAALRAKVTREFNEADRRGNIALDRWLVLDEVMVWMDNAEGAEVASEIGTMLDAQEADEIAEGTDL